MELFKRKKIGEFTFYLNLLVDSSNTGAITRNGNRIFTFDDPIRSRKIHYEFKDNKLYQAYYEDENDRTVYQYCFSNAKLKNRKTLEKSITNNEYFTHAVDAGTEGTVLVRLVVEPTGLVSETEVVKGINEQFDEEVLKMFLSMKTVITWKPARADNNKVAQELIIPVRFMKSSFSWESSRYNNFYYHDPFLFHNMMIQQQMMMQQMQSIPKTPTFH